jgi:hypothetical protein
MLLDLMTAYWRRALDIEVRGTSDIGSLRKAVDAACKELGVKLQTLDVPMRDRLVARILSLLSSAN